MPLEPGTRLGGYTILEAIRPGGMGEIDRAHDPRLDRRLRSITPTSSRLGKPELKLKLNHHFRVQPGAALNKALQQVHATARYVF